LRWFLLLSVSVMPAFAAEYCYTADAADGQVTFRVLQDGAPFTGNFRRYSGKVCTTQDRITRIDASLDPSSVDTGLPELDANLLKADFFDTGKYPGVTFNSTSVETRGEDITVHGTLAIKDKKRGVAVVLHSQQANGKISISGTFTLDRLDYGIGIGEWTNTKWLGAEVKVDIYAVLTRKK
jgi:polyisoprenoid-binding protein YceI